MRRLGESHVVDVAVDRTRAAMALADSTLPDPPLVCMNPAFERLTGYGRDEAGWRNGRFLHGPRTAPDSVRRTSDAVGERRDTDEEIYNHRRDGSGRRNALRMGPVFDGAGHLASVFASQLDVTAHLGSQARQAVLLSGLQHRTRNLICVDEALSSQTLRGDDTPEGFAASFAGRLGALARSQKLPSKAAWASPRNLARFHGEAKQDGVGQPTPSC